MKRYADKMITLAKRARARPPACEPRHPATSMALNKLFGTLGPRFKTRPGGYTRIIRVGRRVGDDAELR